MTDMMWTDNQYNTTGGRDVSLQTYFDNVIPDDDVPIVDNLTVYNYIMREVMERK